MKIMKIFQQMNKIILNRIILYVFVLGSLNLENTKSNEDSKLHLINQELELVKINKIIKIRNNYHDTVIDLNKDYIINCDSLEYWLGSIQESGSRKVYILGECFNARNSYDIVLLPKNLYENPLNVFHKNKNFWYKYFTAYVFFVDKEPVQNPENEFDKYENVFPSVVKVIKSTDTRRWVYIGSIQISSFDEFSKFKISIIENNIN